MSKKNTSLKCTLIVLSLLLLAGCGITSQTTSSTQNTTAVSGTAQAEPKEEGYIYQSGDEVIFINWTEDNNNFTGQVQVTETTDSGIQSSGHAFNGVINGTDISLTISDSRQNDPWAGKVLKGSLDGNSKLTLNFPSSNGAMNPITFISGTVADFNNEVSVLSQNYTKTQSERQAQTQAQGKEQLAQQQSILASLPQIDKKVRIDATTLAGLSFADSLSQYDATLKHMQKDYTKLKADANVQPLTSVQLGTVQVDLGTLQVDLGSFGVQAGLMQAMNSEMQTSVLTLQDDINNYNAFWVSYQNTGGKGSSIVADQMSSSIANAQVQISKAGEAMKSAQAQAGSYTKQAQDLLNTAQAFVSALKVQDPGNG